MTVTPKWVCGNEPISYFTRLGTFAKNEPALTHIGGDALIPGVKALSHRQKDALYPDLMYIARGDKADVAIDFTSIHGLKVPVMYQIPRNSIADQRDMGEKVRGYIRDQRLTVMKELDEAQHGGIRQQTNVLQKYALTEKNLTRLLNANQIKGITEIRRALSDPEKLVDWDRVQRYYKGYHGELNPSKLKRALLRVAYRPVIMGRAMLRTFRNVDEIASKGTRTIWITVPLGIVISLLVAAVSLQYVNKQDKKKQSPSPSNLF
jgi:hypothetical protein